jgi:hypothetical protein
MGLGTPIWILLSVNAAIVASWKVGQVVNTTSGPVKGHESPRHKEVSEYLGTTDKIRRL